MIKIRTRGHRIDYSVGFLLTKKATKMPNSDYKSDLEYPTCILEKTEQDKIYLFLSGIPSKRKDWRKTPIVYDLVINSDDESKQEGKLSSMSEGLTRLIWTWLEDVKKALKEETSKDKRSSNYVVQLPLAGASKLGEILDEKFPTSEIEKILELTQNGKWENNDEEELKQKLEKFIKEFPKPETFPDLSNLAENDFTSWWGGVNNDYSCKQWIKLVKELLESKKKGKALLLNGGTDAYLNELFVEKEEYLGVLLDRKWSNSPPESIEPKARENEQRESMNDQQKKKRQPRLI